MKRVLSVLLVICLMLTLLPTAAFAQTTNESDFVIENGVLKKYTGDNEIVVIPDGVTQIGYAVFRNCEFMIEIHFPKSLKVINEYAFYLCSNLKEVVFSEGLEKIGELAFGGCNSLPEVQLPLSIKDIGVCAFNGCSNLRSINFDALVNLKKIRMGAFCGTALENVKLTSQIQYIGKMAFAHCDQLTEVSVPEGFTNIQYNAFYNSLWQNDLLETKGYASINGLLLKVNPVRLSDQVEVFYLPDTVTKISSVNIGYPKAVVIPPSIKDASKLNVISWCTQTVYGEENTAAMSLAIEKNINFIPFALNKTDMILCSGQYFTLSFNSGSPAEWKSDDSTVVSVDQNGKITAKKAGTATITATLYGKDYTCNVTVSDNAYTVKRGDTLWGISHKYLGAGIRYKEIMELNGLKSTLIHAGKKLYLPEK